MRKAPFALVAALLLVSCGNKAPSTAETTRSLAQKIATQCSGVSAPDLGQGTVCFDNGFRVNGDEFSFANWGRSTSADANVTVQTLVNLFGHSAVCLPGAEAQCILRPAAIQKLEQWNNALAGGRCEGIATLSNRLFLKYDYPSDFSVSAQQASDLEKTNQNLTQSIVYWWATQFLNEVSDRAAESRTKSPLQLVDELVQGLAQGVGYTLGLYYGAQGHTVTPFAVTQRDDTFVVHIYDNNNPNARREVLVNKTSDTWMYTDAQTALDGSPIDWSGAKGSFELVPISTRQGPFTCPFCNTTTNGSPRVLTIASRDSRSPGYVSIRTRSGKTLESTPEGMSNSISGATYNIGKGGENGVVEISIPESAGDFDVFVKRTSANVPASDVVVNLRQSGSASIQIVGNLAETTIGSKTSATALIAVRQNDTTVHAPHSSNARISVAAGTNLSRTNLEPSTSLVIRNIQSNSIEVSLKGAANENISQAHFAATNSTDVLESTWALDGEQQFTAIHSHISAVSVNSQTPHAFTPRKAPQTTSTTEVPSSIVISRPD